MGAEKIQEHTYTVEEYLKLEAASEEKHEFWDGAIVAMVGGTPNHSKISNSIGTAIDIELIKQNKNCATYNSDLKVHIPAFSRFVYPDCMVLCEKEEMYEGSKVIIKNPSLIIEVLSASTKEYDMSSKFEGYRSLPSFKEYMIIWQTITKVQTWYREAEDLWRISSAFGLDKTIQLYSIDCEIALKDIYRRVIDDLGDKDDPKAY